MADEGKVSVITQGSRTGDDSLITAQDAKLRKELNAYAVMAYVAVSDRNAMAEQLRGLSHLTKAVDELREKLAEAEEKAESLQLEVWRNEAFVTRSRIQLRMKDSEIAGLRKELSKGQSTDDRNVETDQSGTSPEAEECESKEEQVEEDKEPSQGDGVQADKDTDKKPKSHQPEKSDYLMNRGLQIGVSREIHEAVVHENLQLKSHLKQLLVDQGRSLQDLMDTIQYKEIIKQLKRKIDEKEEEMAKVRATLEQAESPKEQTAKALLDMEEKVKNSERTIKMKQVMMEALSSRIEQLTKALEKLQRRDEIQMAHMRSAFSDGYRSTTTTTDSSVDEALPSMQIKNLTKENEKLKKLQKHQGSENDSLRQERDAAQAGKKEVQQQLATLSQMKFQPCTICTDLKTAIERVEDELSITKGELSAAIHQVETYKSDFKERCAEMERAKAVLRSDRDLWKMNCQKLNKQMELMKNELDNQMKNNSKLMAEKQYFTQAIQQKMGYVSDYSASMPPMDQQCGEKVNLWQESTNYGRIRSEIAVGDGPDMPSPQEEASSPQDHQWTTARPSSSRRRPGKLTCIKCRREFSPSRQMEYEEHQRTCLGNS